MDQNDYFNIFKAAIDIRGGTVLEVGGSVSPEQVGAAGVDSWTSINISANWDPAVKPPAWYSSQRMSVTDLKFPDGHFDAVFSSNCFEHVDDIPKAFAEIYRVLKPGGMLFTVFGPIWSGPIGHHTWVWDNGKPLTFNDNVFPPWSHLRKNRSELGELLRWKYSAETVDKIVRYVYDSGDLNRNADSVFEREISRHDFVPLLRHRIKTTHRLSREMEGELRWKHPDVFDFRTTGFFWVMAKEQWSPWAFFRVYLGAARVLLSRKFFRPRMVQPLSKS